MLSLMLVAFIGSSIAQAQDDGEHSSARFFLQSSRSLAAAPFPHLAMNCVCAFQTAFQIVERKPDGIDPVENLLGLTALSKVKDSKTSHLPPFFCTP